MVSLGTGDTVVDAASFEVGLMPRVDPLRVVLVKPLIEFFYLLGRDGVYGPCKCMAGSPLSLPS